MRARLGCGPAIVTAVIAAFTSIASAVSGQERANPPIPGMVRQTEIRIAPETTGRLASIAVAAGQHVKKGDLLAVLDNPELTAAVGEARAAAASARADRARVYSGVRAEEVAIATQTVHTAEANLLLAQQQYKRAAALAGKDFTSQQKLDESVGSLAKAEADLDLKRPRPRRQVRVRPRKSVPWLTHGRPWPKRHLQSCRRGWTRRSSPPRRTAQ